MEKNRTNDTRPWLNKNLLGFSFASLFSDSNHEIVPLVLPMLLVGLVGPKNAPQYVGFISGFATAAASFAILFSGWLSDRLANRKPLILFGYALTGTGIGLLAFAHSSYEVFVLITLAWVGRGLCSAPRNAIIADSIAPAFYGHAFGFRQAFDTLGAILGPLLVYFLSAAPLSTLFYISFIPGLLAVAIIAFFISDVPHRVMAQKPFFDTSGLTREFYALLGIVTLFGLGNFNRTLLLLRIQNTLEIGQSHAAALSLITLLYIFRNIIQTFSAYYMGAVSDKIGRKIPLAVCGFGFFGLMAVSLIYPSSHLGYLLCIFFLSGFSAGTYMTLQKTMAADVLPESARGTGYGILQIANSTADLISSIIVGFLWTTVSAEVAFLYAAFMSLCAAFVLLKTK